MASGYVARGAWSLAVVGAGVFMARSAASAEPAKPAEEAPEQADKEAVDPSFRIDLGMGLTGVGSGSGGAGTGMLGGLMPYAQTSFEGHLSGPVWLAVRASGGYARHTYGNDEATSWALRLQLGPRFELPVVPRVELGGHVLVEGAVVHEEADAAGGVLYSTGHVSVGGLAGPSVHFRVTPLFGVRLAIDVLRAGYVWSGEGSSAYAELTANPSVAMTFTF